MIYDDFKKFIYFSKQTQLVFVHCLQIASHYTNFKINFNAFATETVNMMLVILLKSPIRQTRDSRVSIWSNFGRARIGWVVDVPLLIRYIVHIWTQLRFIPTDRRHECPLNSIPNSQIIIEFNQSQAYSKLVTLRCSPIRMYCPCTHCHINSALYYIQLFWQTSLLNLN